ncbi:MAG: hypothetical protein JKY51_04000 [Opitutaceae bacterium]|nr:hypothetical protein [Opitutaceae bacterium]
MLNKNDPDNAVLAMREAANRLIKRKEELWPLDELSVEGLSARYGKCEFVSIFDNAKLVAGVIVSFRKPDYWPSDIVDISSIYISKLSVTDAYIGQKISSKIVGEIELLYSDSYRFVRLDCDAKRPKLNNIYLDMDFNPIGYCLVHTVYPTNFYEKKIP